MNQQKILVTGASGFVGWNLVPLLCEKGLAPVLIQNKTPLDFDAAEALPLDLTDAGYVIEAVDRIKPDAVIHCAALSNGKNCEEHPDQAQRQNVDATVHLLNALPEKTRFIFLSTDLVFDGLKGDYHEDDLPRPLSEYAASKIRAENFIRENAANAVIVRTALVYGRDAPHYSCFLGWMHQACRQKQPLTLFTDEFRTPVHVLDLCGMLVRLIDSDFCGTLHIAGPQRLSRHEFGLKFCEAFDYDPELLNPLRLDETVQPVYHPPDVSLNISLARRMFDFKPRDVQSGLEQLKSVEESFK